MKNRRIFFDTNPGLYYPDGGGGYGDGDSNGLTDGSGGAGLLDVGGNIGDDGERHGGGENHNHGGGKSDDGGDDGGEKVSG